MRHKVDLGGHRQKPRSLVRILTENMREVSAIRLGAHCSGKLNLHKSVSEKKEKRTQMWVINDKEDTEHKVHTKAQIPFSVPLFTERTHTEGSNLRWARRKKLFFSLKRKQRQREEDVTKASDIQSITLQELAVAGLRHFCLSQQSAMWAWHKPERVCENTLTWFCTSTMLRQEKGDYLAIPNQAII